MNLLRQDPMGQKVPRPADDPAYLAQVRSLPCCICDSLGRPQEGPTFAHHCIHGRFSQRKAPDCMAIPLCHWHHQGTCGVHTIPTGWRRLYGEDTDWIAVTQDKLGFGK